jgi:intraflagellar transport protein 52
MHEGGENKLGTNINFLLEQLGISVNPDSVIRKTYYKYLHPKEAYVGNGILNNELVR